MTQLEFFYEDAEVGYFESPVFPDQNGTYSYMPYRGEAHFRMQEDIMDYKFPRCYYVDAEERVFFTVIDCPEKGVIEIASLEKITKAG